MLVKCLEVEGVEYIFGILGEENLEVMNVIVGLNIKFIIICYE